MGARVDAAEGGAHPFLTAHFLTTPPPVFVFNPRHSRRPWVHSLLVQKGGGACCSLLQCSRSVFSSRTRTILAIPPSVHGGCDRSLHSTVPPSPPSSPFLRQRASPTRQRDFDARSSRDHPRKVRRPFRLCRREANQRPDIGTPTLGAPLRSTTTSYQSARVLVRNNSPSFLFLLFFYSIESEKAHASKMKG